MNTPRIFKAFAASIVLSALGAVSFAQGAPDAGYTVKPGDVLETFEVEMRERTL